VLAKRRGLFYFGWEAKVLNAFREVKNLVQAMFIAAELPRGR